MAAIETSEVKPGLVAYIDPATLIAEGGCETNAAVGAEVKDVHYFLVVELSDDGQNCLATPLYSEKNDIRDRKQLKPNLKTGKAGHWTNTDSFYYKWQFWRIPVSAFCAASHFDDSDKDTRRVYAGSDGAKIKAVYADIHKTKEPWRTL